MSKEKLAAMAKAVATGKADAQSLTKELISDRISADQIFKEALVPAMKKVGEGMQEEEYAFPEVQSSIKASDVLDVLKELLKVESPLSRFPSGRGVGNSTRSAVI
jgi:methanogenic corrinoid protein MtbC1